MCREILSSDVRFPHLPPHISPSDLTAHVVFSETAYWNQEQGNRDRFLDLQKDRDNGHHVAKLRQMFT